MEHVPLTNLKLVITSSPLNTIKRHIKDLRKWIKIKYLADCTSEFFGFLEHTLTYSFLFAFSMNFTYTRLYFNFASPKYPRY